MDDLQGITAASGLDKADRATLEALVDVANAVRARNCVLSDYYAAEQGTPSIGIDNLPENVDPGARVDWAKKAVDSVSERVRLGGFAFTGGYEDAAFDRLVLDSGLVGQFNRTVSSELTHGVMFATVQRQGGAPAIRMHSAESAAAIYDTAAARIGAGMAVADVRRTSWSPSTPRVVQVNMHVPGRVVALHRTGPAGWVAESMHTPLDRPMMEAFTFRATGTRPFGQSRITKTVRYYVDEVQRTLNYMAVASAFYAVPMYALMGLSEEMYDELEGKKWSMRVGSFLLSTTDENGSAPKFEKFNGSSPQPYIEAIMTYAKLFSGATGVPLNSLGIVQDNPSSAQAIESARDDICIAAEDCIESNRMSMRNVALMAMAVQNNTTVDGLTDEQRSVMPRFPSPLRPSPARSADAMSKVAAVLSGFAETHEFLEGMGYDAQEVASIRSQIESNANRAALMRIMGGGVADGNGAARSRGDDDGAN